MYKQIKGGALIGHGGYGCVFSPAIVTKKDTIITNQNKHEYVSKISLDPDTEFELTREIISLCRRAKIDVTGDLSLGWYPLAMHCFHLDSTINPRLFLSQQDLETANEHCTNVIDGIFDARHYKKNQTICITQSKKFNFTLADFRGYLWERKFLHDEALIKLKLLHGLGIFHLDIKDSNMAITEGQTIMPDNVDLSIYFTDWDMAKVIDHKSKFATTNYIDALETIRYNKQYYFEHLPFLLFIQNNIKKSEKKNIQDHVLQRDLFDYKKPKLNAARKHALEKVDMLIFISMWPEFYKNLNYTQIINVISGHEPLSGKRTRD